MSAFGGTSSSTASSSLNTIFFPENQPSSTPPGHAADREPPGRPCRGSGRRSMSRLEHHDAPRRFASRAPRGRRRRRAVVGLLGKTLFASANRSSSVIVIDLVMARFTFVKCRDPDDIDYVYYVTAHEVAHQWWAHQVIGARVQGATMLDETFARVFRAHGPGAPIRSATDAQVPAIRTRSISARPRRRGSGGKCRWRWWRINLISTTAKARS